MGASKYVSAVWVEPAQPGDPYTIMATGDDGVEYFIFSPDTDVPPWPEYLAEGGVIDGTGPPEPAQQPKQTE